MLSNLHAVHGQCILHGGFVQLGKYIITLSGGEGDFCCPVERGNNMLLCSDRMENKAHSNYGGIICHSLICHQVSVITFVITGIHLHSQALLLQSAGLIETEVEGFFKISITG